jgi:ribosomal protein L11 methyltransferase
MNSTQQNWFALDVEVESAASEAIEFGFNELEASGTEINNLGLKPSETMHVIGYFNEPPDEETVQFQMTEALRIYGFSTDAIRAKEWRKIGNVDWLFEWKKHWKPTVTEKFIIAPTWENVENTDKIVIRIEPSMAFGTGTHNTTQLCLKAIEDNFENDMNFLDVGTGTGILAIGAAKFQTSDSKSRIIGCDIDENSIKISHENAELNETPNIKFYVGSISAETPQYDFICANLTIDVIIPLLQLLIEKSTKILVLSGILKEQQEVIVAELKKYGIENPQIETSGEWISVLVKS